MARSAPSQPPSGPSASPVRPAIGPARQRRRLAASLLLLVAVSAIAVFLRHSCASLSVASLRGEACSAPGETAAASCPLPQGATATREPFPTEAEAQLDWALRYHQPAMLLFYSQDCRPCMMMDALVQMVHRDYEPAMIFIDVLRDQPENASLVRRLGVRGIPASFFFTVSGESKRVLGLMKQQDLRAELAALVAPGEAPRSTPTALASP